MTVLHVHGGAPLHGEVSASGAKNAVLPLMAAALLTDEPSTLTNVPHLRDVETMRDVMHALGVVTSFAGQRLHVNPANFAAHPISAELMGRMRASYYVIPPLLARRGGAVAGLPGGCTIGDRKIDLHYKAFEALGARVEENEIERTIRVTPKRGGLRGAVMNLLGDRGVSVGATCNALMAAVLAEGDSVIECAAMEPEVVCLAECLRAMGARIAGEGSPTIRVSGVRRLRGVEFAVIPDRIEAGTYLLAGAITRGRITVTNCRPDHMHAVTGALRSMGFGLRATDSTLSVARRPRVIKPLNITTEPYPGFPTDLQSPFVALMTQAEGTSVVHETIFENRFQTGMELRDKMGANISVDPTRALIIQGASPLRPAALEATDLRTGAALVLAALAAPGDSEIRNVHFIQRGYERLEEKLRALGAAVKVVESAAIDKLS